MFWRGLCTVSVQLCVWLKDGHTRLWSLLGALLAEVCVEGPLAEMTASVSAYLTP